MGVPIHWEATEPYEEVGGRATLEAAVREALEATPREHTRLLQSIDVLDTDPKGASLGIYARDRDGARVELYLRPHVLDALRAPEPARLWVVRLHLAHTLFHEIGHHVTLTVNRRATPTRRKASVAQTLEKWAEEYVGRRMQKFCDARLAPGGDAESERDAFLLALRCLGMTGEA